MLVGLDSSRIRTLASLAKKSLEYKCPVCQEDIILKQGQIKIPHYAHYPSSECENAGESYRHMEMKWQVGNIAAQSGYLVDFEKPLNESRADIVLSRLNDNYIIEVQNSPIVFEDLFNRSLKFQQPDLLDHGFKPDVLWLFDKDRLSSPIIKHKIRYQKHEENLFKIPVECRRFFDEFDHVDFMDRMSTILVGKVYGYKYKLHKLIFFKELRPFSHYLYSSKLPNLWEREWN